jgi:hypothetical protein
MNLRQSGELALLDEFPQQFERDAQDKNDKRIHPQFDHSPVEIGGVQLFNGKPGSDRENTSRGRDDANEKKRVQRSRMFLEVMDE